MNAEYLHETIVIMDFGSQYTQLIARRIRELGVFSLIIPFDTNLEELKNSRIKGIILSGGPSSVYQKNAPHIEKKVFDLGLPVLGICYGLQLVMHLMGGKVEASAKREYGKADISIKKTQYKTLEHLKK